MINKIVLVVTICFLAMFGLQCSRDVDTQTVPIIFKARLGDWRYNSEQDSIRIIVVDEIAGTAMAEAWVVCRSVVHPDQKITGRTDEMGVLEIPGKEMSLPIMVTVICCEKQAYNTITLCGLEANEIEIPVSLRKKPAKKREDIYLEGIPNSTKHISIYRNDEIIKEITSKKDEEILSKSKNTVRLRGKNEPFAISVLTEGPHGQNGCGIRLFPDGPSAGATPALIQIREGNRSNSGVRNIEFSYEIPQWLTIEETDPGQKIPPQIPLNQVRTSWAIFADGGISGQVITGKVTEGEDGKLMAAVLLVEKGLSQYVQGMASQKNADLPWSQSRFKITQGQEIDSRRIEFVKPPQGIQWDKIVTGGLIDRYRLKWLNPYKGSSIIHLSNSQFDYHWTIYMFNSSESNTLELPIWDPAIPGGLIPGIEYSVVIEFWDIDQFDLLGYSFQKMHENLKHRSSSALFSLKIPIIPVEVDNYLVESLFDTL